MKSYHSLDKIITGDLLRFYTPEGFKATDKTKYNYKYSEGPKQPQTGTKKINQRVSCSKNNGNSTENLYETDAPELKPV